MLRSSSLSFCTKITIFFESLVFYTLECGNPNDDPSFDISKSGNDIYSQFGKYACPAILYTLKF